MHELSLIADLMNKIETIAHEQNSPKIVSVAVTLGALSHISADHFRQHFIHASRGTVAEDARLDIEALTDINDPHAQEIRLERVEVEA